MSARTCPRRRKFMEATVDAGWLAILGEGDVPVLAACSVIVGRAENLCVFGHFQALLSAHYAGSIPRDCLNHDRREPVNRYRIKCDLFPACKARVDDAARLG